jgi:hypothetical protein
MKATTRSVHKQPSFQIRSTTVEASVTETGGHLAPVVFDREGRRIQPYSIAPWAEEKIDPALPAILRVLRGDFFCAPFGGNEQAWRSEKHPVHGETANNKWLLESMGRTDGRTTLHLSMETSIRKGRVDKRISVVDGHNAVYCQHVLSGMTGPMNVGHHATLKFPDAPGGGIVSFSPFRYGQVFPLPFEKPECRGYQALKPGAEFSALTGVPMLNGEMADLSRYPARAGFEDLVQVIADSDREVAWTAVSFPRERYAWFALKDPKVLNGTIMWISNGGRHYAPWNGRHVGVMGLEEVTSYFHIGLAASARDNPFNGKGFATALQLSPRKPAVINYIMGVALTPANFTEVTKIEVDDKGCTLIAENGKKARAAVDVGFLKSGA